MQSEFRLLKHTNGIPHFARVAVNARPAPNTINVVEAICESITEGDGEVNRRIASWWIDAALAGAEKCAEALVSQGKFPGCYVEVKRVVGSLVDTSEEDVFCAAALATWQALKPTAELPQFYFAENKWQIAF